MPKHALAYAWAVCAVGAAVAVSAAFLWQSAGAAALLTCLGLAALASTFKVTLPGLTGTISPGFVLLLVALARLSWSETVGIGVASALVQSLWRAKRRPAGLQIGFNAATMAISGGFAYGVSHGLAQTAGDPMLLLAVSGVALLVTNTLIVSSILCLLKDAPLSTVWRSLQPRAVPYYLAGGLLAGVWSRADLTAGYGVALMAGVSVYLLGLCYRETAERFGYTDPGAAAQSKAWR